MKANLNVLIATAGIATILLTGCVSSKKYKSSQAALAQMRNDSARLAQQVTSLNENVQNLEQKNTTLQRTLDSTTGNYATQQKSLDYYQEYFNKQQGTLSQVSDALKGALSQTGVANEDIQQVNNAIYVNLDENKIFKKNSTAVTTSGKQALSSLAQVIKSRSDVNVVVSDGDSSGGQSSNMGNPSSTMGNATSANNVTSDNMSDNAAPRHHRAHHMMAHRKTEAKGAAAAGGQNAGATVKTDNSGKSDVAVTHRKTKRKYASSEGSMTFYNSPTRYSKNRAWMLKQGRVNSVANGLLQNGVPKVNLLMQQPISNGLTPGNGIKVIITPTMSDFTPQNSSAAKGGE
ncbi:hypothetical protein Q4E93_02115 [Flavitalea sp. BT771]|uniref:hypothetical protein n=1 Tax=Flavitalea sp. BT771 TaxID=3063329 RepID=UPI0026E290AB|nr:hypothetical protein [Flavitalea sp. BT771]MDO6429365.1 hypothetical protein [Flavitalea sp. BT771]MDV6218507.1 hypothetical protein [Flavitalea sp. BT771]